jgi:hypothetical protein
MDAAVKRSGGAKHPEIEEDVKQSAVEGALKEVKETGNVGGKGAREKAEKEARRTIGELKGASVRQSGEKQAKAKLAEHEFHGVSPNRSEKKPDLEATPSGYDHDPGEYTHAEQSEPKPDKNKRVSRIGDRERDSSSDGEESHTGRVSEPTVKPKEHTDEGEHIKEAKRPMARRKLLPKHEPKSLATKKKTVINDFQFKDETGTNYPHPATVEQAPRRTHVTARGAELTPERGPIEKEKKPKEKTGVEELTTKLLNQVKPKLRGEPKKGKAGSLADRNASIHEATRRLKHGQSESQIRTGIRERLQSNRTRPGKLRTRLQAGLTAVGRGKDGSSGVHIEPKKASSRTPEVTTGKKGSHGTPAYSSFLPKISGSAASHAERSNLATLKKLKLDKAISILKEFYKSLFIARLRG